MILKGKTIFVVEDNQENRVTYSIAIQLAGAKAIFERHGKNTTLLLRRYRNMDLIILDLILKDGISGYDLFQEIRAVPRFSYIPIVAVSAAEPYEAMERCRQLGFDGFISKPINDLTFTEQLAQIIKGKQVWAVGI